VTAGGRERLWIIGVLEVLGIAVVLPVLGRLPRSRRARAVGRSTVLVGSTDKHRSGGLCHLRWRGRRSGTQFSDELEFQGISRSVLANMCFSDPNLSARNLASERFDATDELSRLEQMFYSTQ
jgi:hypothetical protein